MSKSSKIVFTSALLDNTKLSDVFSSLRIIHSISRVKRKKKPTTSNLFPLGKYAITEYKDENVVQKVWKFG
jgi:hypothetical protein